MARQPKRRILVVGGVDKNIPTWIRCAFEIDHFESEHGRNVAPSSKAAVDAVIVLNAWVSHKHYYDARSFAESRKVPCLVSPGGWSKAIRLAAEIGLDWFISAIEQAKDRMLREEDQEELDQVIDNAWREAYEREWAKNQVLEKRLAKDRKMFDKALASKAKARTREEAANRVITEVREAAKRQREHLDKATIEVRETAERVAAENAVLAEYLSSHFDELRDLLDRLGRGEQALVEAARMMAKSRTALQQSVTNLQNRLRAAHAATTQVIEPPSFTEDQPEPEDSPSQR